MIYDNLVICIFLPSLPIIGDTKSFANHELKVKVPLLEKKEKIPFLFLSQLHLSERFMAWQPCKLMGSSYSRNRPSRNCATMSLQLLPQLCTWRISFDWTLQSSLQVCNSSSLSLTIEYFTVHTKLNHQTLQSLLLSTVIGERSL